MRVWLHVRNYLRHFFVPGAHNAHRPRILHRPWLIFFLGLTLATEGFLVSNLIARQNDQQFLAAVVPAEIIALTNTERAGNNVGNLTEDQLLDSAAQAKATDMAANEYFSHVGPDGKTPWQWVSASGYQYQYAGENLAVRFINSSDVMNAWMASPTHRENIVKPVYTQIGVGVAEGMYQGQPATYVVQYFGTPKSAENAQPAAVAAVTAPPATAKPAQVKAAPVVAAKTTPPTPKVEGAETTAPVPTPVQTPAQPSSFSQSLVKQVIRAFSEPQQTANLLLGFITVLLLGVLVLTFFTHLQIQHGSMLLSGAFVAMLALFFLLVNARLVGSLPNSTQEAGVAASQGGVIINADAAETGYALFPN